MCPLSDLTRVNRGAKRARVAGITLFEVLTVCAIVAITSAIIYGVIAKAKNKAYESPCQSNLRQIGLALETYLADSDGQYPVMLGDLVTAVPAVKSVIVCPSDRSRGANWQDTARLGIKSSVFYWRAYPNGYRQALEAADPSHGVAYCVLHGRALPQFGDRPNVVSDTTGTTLRLLADGSVRVAQVGFHCGKLPDGSTLVMRSEWSLLTDAKCTDLDFCSAAPDPCVDPRE